MSIYPILFTLLFLSGCGPATILRQTYEAEAYDVYEDKGRKVFVGISATRQLNSNLPFSYFNFQGGPYKLFVLGHSHLDYSGTLQVLSAKVTFPESTSIDLVNKAKRNSCELKVSKAKSSFNDCYVYLPFGDVLQFKKDYQFTVEVTFQFSGSEELGSLKLKMKSLESIYKGTTFDVLMSA